MTFPDHPPPPPFLPPPPFAKVDFWRQNGVDKDDDENSHALKRPQTLINNNNPRSNQTNFPRMNDPPSFPRMNSPHPPLNRGASYIFYKTRMCLKFLDGNCRNGDHCTFAHGAEDLREPPPNWQEIVGQKENVNHSYDDHRSVIHRFKICKKYANGEECPYGENCNFLHKRGTASFDAAEVDGPRESYAIRIGTNEPVNGPVNGPVLGIRSGLDQTEVVDMTEKKHVLPGSDVFRVNMKSAYWKTKLCSVFEITGHCPFGDRCRFAHGQADMQLSGVRIEAEAVNMLSCVPATKPVSVPTTVTTDVNTVLVAPTTDSSRVKKFSEKWKGPKKINSIYADWLDGFIPPLMLPKNFES